MKFNTAQQIPDMLQKLLTTKKIYHYASQYFNAKHVFYMEGLTIRFRWKAH